MACQLSHEVLSDGDTVNLDKEEIMPGLGEEFASHEGAVLTSILPARMQLRQPRSQTGQSRLGEAWLARRQAPLSSGRT